MDINDKYDKLNNNESYLGVSRLMRKQRRVHRNSAPLNDLYWHVFSYEEIQDKSIAMHNIRFVNYIDPYNNLVKPFKK